MFLANNVPNELGSIWTYFYIHVLIIALNSTKNMLMSDLQGAGVWNQYYFA